MTTTKKKHKHFCRICGGRGVKARRHAVESGMQVKSQDVDVVFGVSRADSRRAFKDAVKGVELPPIGREDVDHARIALKTYISQWCAAGITAEVSELIHDLIRAAEVRGLNRAWTATSVVDAHRPLT